MGSHHRRAAQGLPVGRLAGRAGRVGLEDCRWTPCYDCGVCTGYGIEHVVASPVPPAGGSQGTGQDLVGGGGPGHATAPAIAASASGHRMSGRRCGIRFHQARQDPLHEPPRRGPHVGAGVAPRRAPGRVHRGLHAPAQNQLRPRPADRRRVDRRVPRHRPADPTWRPSRRRRDAAAPAHAGPPRGFDVRRRRARRRAGSVAAGSRHVAARGGSTLAGSTPDDRSRRRRGDWPPTTLSLARERKGSGAPTTSARHPRSRVAATDDGTSTFDRRPRHPAARPAAQRARRPAGSARRRRCGCSRTHQWIDHDGARREPLPLRRDGSAPARAGACVMRREPPDDRLPTPADARRAGAAGRRRADAAPPVLRPSAARRRRRQRGRRRRGAVRSAAARGSRGGEPVRRRRRRRDGSTMRRRRR